ncbi:MAG: hypothetical protein LBM72_02430 [Mycoplasmataceae bacterium]|jgi:hypothetical protein|nr:hypothetical protein [Mycoplasmataceae bacterium]
MAKYRVKAILTETKTLIKTVEAVDKKRAIAKVMLKSKNDEWKNKSKLEADAI